jgi:hypothetical protein
MFIARSAFWLVAAFLVVHPHDVDVQARATALADSVVANGQQLIAAQLLHTACPVVCTAQAPDALASLLPSTVASPMQGSPTRETAPFPRQRPSWLG